VIQLRDEKGAESEPNLHIELAADAYDNGLATMLADLVRQNLVANPDKRRHFRSMRGRVSIVAEDADVALTLCFESGGRLTIHDGIVGVPSLTVRGPADAILALSNLPLATRLALPIPRPGDAEGMRTVRAIASAVRKGKLHFYGAVLHPWLAMKLTRVMSIHGS
jgi:hypothetical protein